MQFITDLNHIAEEAIRRADDYDAFGYYVRLQEMSDQEFDRLVEDIAKPIIEAIDCTDCANCCHSLDVYLTQADEARLRQIIPLDTIIDYEGAQAQGEWACLAKMPCPLLNGKLCSVYEHRPEACRAYPAFTPDFRWIIRDVLGGIGSCPIIYNVIEQLQHELGWK